MGFSSHQDFEKRNTEAVQVRNVNHTHSAPARKHHTHLISYSTRTQIFLPPPSLPLPHTNPFTHAHLTFFSARTHTHSLAPIRRDTPWHTCSSEASNPYYREEQICWGPRGSLLFSPAITEKVQELFPVREGGKQGSHRAQDDPNVFLALEGDTF